MFSSCDVLPYHWNTTSMAERVGLPPCNGSPILNILTYRFSVPTYSGRESDKDSIPAEIYKAAGPRAMEFFLDISQSIWDQEKMPDDFRDALIVTLYKNKGSKADCGNYRGISLLSIAGKNLYSYHSEQTHCSFRSQPTRSPMWIPPWSQHSEHDIYSETGSGEMP